MPMPSAAAYKVRKDIEQQEPNVQVWEVSLRGDRSITLRHAQRDRIPLDEDDAKEVLKHMHHLWRFDVHLESVWDEKVQRVYHCNDDKVWTDSGDISSSAATS